MAAGGTPIARLVSVVISCVMTLVLLLVCVLTFQRRATFPIHGRLWPLNLAIGALFVVAMVNTIYDDLFGADARSVGFRFAATVGPTACIYTLRAWYLLKSYRIAHKAHGMLEHGAGGTNGAREWLRRQRNMQSPRVICFILAVFCVLFGSFMLSLELIGLGPASPEAEWFYLSLAIITCLTLLPTAVCACKMRVFLDDSFLVRLEFRWVGYYTLLLAVCLVAALLFTQRQVDRWHVAVVGLHMLIAGCSVFLFLVPLRTSYSVEQSQRLMYRMGLAEVLSRAKMRAAFRAFLMLEFSAENLDFYERVEQLKLCIQHHDDKQLALESGHLQRRGSFRRLGSTLASALSSASESESSHAARDPGSSDEREQHASSLEQQRGHLMRQREELQHEREREVGPLVADIFRDFVSQDAPLQVNISGAVRARLVSILGHRDVAVDQGDGGVRQRVGWDVAAFPAETLFEAATVQVYKLMEKDALPRFRHMIKKGNHYSSMQSLIVEAPASSQSARMRSLSLTISRSVTRQTHSQTMLRRFSSSVGFSSSKSGRGPNLSPTAVGPEVNPQSLSSAHLGRRHHASLTLHRASLCNVASERRSLPAKLARDTHHSASFTSKARSDSVASSRSRHFPYHAQRASSTVHGAGSSARTRTSVARTRTSLILGVASKMAKRGRKRHSLMVYHSDTQGAEMLALGGHTNRRRPVPSPSSPSSSSLSSSSSSSSSSASASASSSSALSLSPRSSGASSSYPSPRSLLLAGSSVGRQTSASAIALAHKHGSGSGVDPPTALAPNLTPQGLACLTK